MKKDKIISAVFYTVFTIVIIGSVIFMEYAEHQY